MKDIKKFIEENRAHWDQQELPEGHEERFLNRLESMGNPKSKTINWNFIMRVAASVLLVVSVVWLTVEPFKSTKASSRVHDITIGADMQEVISYYSIQTRQDTAAMRQLSKINPATEKIDQTARRQLEKLEGQLLIIEKDYAKNPGNEAVRAALINAQQKKAEIMNSLKKEAQTAAHYRFEK